MGLRTTLEMLKRGDEAIDALYRSTTRDERTRSHLDRAPSPWERYRALAQPLNERAAAPQAG